MENRSTAVGLVKRFANASVVVGLLAVISAATAAVTLTQSTVDYHHKDVKLNGNRTEASVGGDVVTTYKALVLENEYVIIKVVPDYGSRVISMVYKPTGHEELWSWSSAAPQGIGEGSFYYNWLMVWGGIFPTLSAPEHGKYWNLPWAYKIAKQTADTVSVTMTQTDTVPFRSGYADKFGSYGATGMVCDFTVTLVSKKTGFGVDVTLSNPSGNAIQFEYWTCTTMSPGSVPGNLHLTQNAEFIVPDDTVMIPGDWGAIRGKEQNVGGNSFVLNNLRWWKNWSDMGIVYAQPKANFWGCINHDDSKEEGIMRICDNKTTYACKMWTWGINGLPYFEPWGGVSDQFFSKASMNGLQTKQWHEFYTPTIGLSKVTNASEDLVANLTTDKTKYDGNVNDSVRVVCQFFCAVPTTSVQALVTLEGAGSRQVIYANAQTPDTKNGNSIKVSVPVKSVYNGVTKLAAQFTDNAGRTLLTAAANVSFANAGTVPSAVLPHTNGRGGIVQPKSFATLYSLSGERLGVYSDAAEVRSSHVPAGVYLVKTNASQMRLVISK